MEYKISDRVQTLKPSAIREIFKYAADPTVVSLSAGNPAPEAFPAKEIAEISSRMMAEHPVDALQYGLTEGYLPLRQHLAAYMKEKHQVGRDFDDILITSGAQQVMDLTTKSPSGITMSFEKRKQLYALAKQYGVLILEDNPYGDIRIKGESIPCIKSMDEDGIVIYAGTFSKVISPGMRVGYAIAPKALLQKLVVCKQGADVHTSMWGQIVCHEFMTKYDYEAHLARLRELYDVKSALALRKMDECLVPNKITYNPFEGGLFLWCTLPAGVDMPAFCKEAVLRKVCVVPGNAFLTDESEPCQSFRINYSTPTNEQLVKGIEILGQLAKDIL